MKKGHWSLVSKKLTNPFALLLLAPMLLNCQGTPTVKPNCSFEIYQGDSIRQGLTRGDKTIKITDPDVNGFSCMNEASWRNFLSCGWKVKSETPSAKLSN